MLDCTLKNKLVSCTRVLFQESAQVLGLTAILCAEPIQAELHAPSPDMCIYGPPLSVQMRSEMPSYSSVVLLSTGLTRPSPRPTSHQKVTHLSVFIT